MPLSLSRHNIIRKMRGSSTWFIVNPLAKTADLLEEEEARAIQEGRYADIGRLIERGYLVDPEQEAGFLRRAFVEHSEARDSEEVQLFFTPTFACNFGCDYCYQEDYPGHGAPPSAAVVRALFAAIDAKFAKRKKYLTLFGGEPLLPSPEHRRMIEAVVEGARARNLPLAVVTNGYHLESYLDALGWAPIRELQVTLDGVGAVHDRRRPLKGGGSTFDAIVAGIDAALERGHRINLRMVVDKDNLAALPELARFAIARGWTKNPKFKTQLGRNYELHGCQPRSDRLFTRLELYEALTEMIQAHPEVLEFHRPAYHVARFLFDEGQLPDPLFDACPACKTEWAFDASGRIYPCTATVGKPGEEVGTFFPALRLEEERVEAWESRDVLAIAECRTCSSQLICGGGCGAVAKNRTGRVDAPDCRPVPELLELGMSLYFRDSVSA